MTPIAATALPRPQISPEVAAALAAGRPVLALESTVIAHGLPYPANLETALTLEATARAAGVTPATVAVLDGMPRVGLNEDDLRLLATSQSVRKLSRRDLGIALARRLHGATTVATTMILAARAGVRVFATGGIGGVHRGDARDISADLPELARTPMVVVCAGAKAILDLPATLEWLETHGAPVLGYGTDEFPAFYAVSSGLPVDARVDSAAEAAAIARAQWEWGLESAVLVAVPPPADVALPSAQVEAAIAAALGAAAAAGVRGRELTPFLLREVSRLTAGASLETNLALLRRNVAVGAEIARALCAMPPAERGLQGGTSC